MPRACMRLPVARLRADWQQTHDCPSNVAPMCTCTCVCNMSITSETCRRSACVSSVLYRSVHVCEALCSERAWQWRPKAGATRCAHCFFALYATFFLHGAERAECISDMLFGRTRCDHVATSHEQFGANAVRTARGRPPLTTPTHAHHYAKQPTKA